MQLPEYQRLQAVLQAQLKDLRAVVAFAAPIAIGILVRPHEDKVRHEAQLLGEVPIHPQGDVVLFTAFDVLAVQVNVTVSNRQLDGAVFMMRFDGPERACPSRKLVTLEIQHITSVRNQAARRS